MRIATYNVEWFANLFDDRDHLIMDDGWSGRENVTRIQQVEALAKVFSVLDADAIMVVEAPNSGKKQSSTRALEGFARSFDLRQKKAMIGFANETHQEITLLYDPAVLHAGHDPKGNEQGAAPRFDGVLHMDLDVDGIQETIRFSKPPLEVELTPHGRDPIRLIGVHVKSKIPHGAKNLAEQMRLSVTNRRKQLAQCIWIRRRVDEHLAAGDPVIVLGDLNDGPGLDEYENLFGHSGLETVLGCDRPLKEQLYDPAAILAMSPRAKLRPSSSRFFLRKEDRFLNALLDYILVSPDLRKKAKKWEIWHPFDNPRCYADPELRAALLNASDHFPVMLDIDI